MIRFQLLGVPDLRTDGGAKAFTVLAQSKQVAMLGVLCVARDGSVRRERLLSLLWPDLEDARARNSLSKAIHNCRRTLGEEALGGRFAEELALETKTWSTDLWDFDDAAETGDHDAVLRLALAGDFLDGLHVPDSHAFDLWLSAERARIRRVAMTAATALADRDEAAGDGERATEHLRIAATFSPLDERILRRRCTLIDQLGDRAGALELFADFRLLLQRELDVEPSPETVALVESIRRRAIRTEPVSEPAPPTAVPAAVLPPDGLAAGAHRSPADHDERGTVDASEARAATGEPASVATSMAQRNGTAPLTRGRRLPLAGAAAVFVAVLAGGLFAARRNDGPILSEPGRVIVAPFVNQTNDSTLAPIGELAADMLAASLTRAGVAEVADGRTRMRTGLTMVNPAGGGDVEELADRARRAGFNTIITGRYYLMNGALTVIAQIRSADEASPVVRFAEEQGPVGDPAPLLRRVEQRLLGAFATMRGAKLPAASTGSAAAPSYAAYVEYVGGLRPWIDGDLTTAAAHFERAFTLDSNFVSVVPMLYEAWMSSNRSDSADSLLAAVGARQRLMAPYDQAQLAYISDFHGGRRENMYEATQRMVRLAPHSPDAQWSHGFAAATTNRFEEAIQAFEAAEVERWWTRDKLFASVHWQSISYHLLERHTDELALVRRVMAQHPFEADVCVYEVRATAPVAAVPELDRAIEQCIVGSGGTTTAWRAAARLTVAAELRTHGRPREARQFAGAAVALLRDTLQRDSRSKMLQEQLANGLMELGEWEAALTVLEPMARSLPDNRPPRIAANTAIVALKLGRTALADEMLARLRERTPFSAFHLQRARVLAHRGQPVEAVAELREAIGKGLSATELFHANFGLEPLRTDPAYDALVKPRP